MSEGLTVRFRDCQCPGTPHDGRDGADDGDIVTMRPVLGFAAGARALRLIIESDGDVNRIAELVGPVYVEEGPTGWNVIADDGSPAPLDVAAILADYSWAYPVAERGDDLYSTAVLKPFLTRMSATSVNGQSGASTSRTRRSSRAARSPRKSSSGNGSAGLPSQATP